MAKPASSPISSTTTLNAVNPSRFLVSELCDLLETYLQPAQVKEIYQAYLFSAEAHDGQKRLTGEPYVYHPLAVAKIMAEMHLDQQSITAAILHDVIEDTPTAKEKISEIQVLQRKNCKKITGYLTAGLCLAEVWRSPFQQHQEM